MIDFILTLLISHPFILSIVGPSFFGGATILVLGILSGKGLLPFLTVLIFCAVGMLCADTIWFFVGRIKGLSKMNKYRWIQRTYKRAREEIEVAPSSKFLLILIKFAYGIAIPILMYLGRKKMTLKEFLITDGIIIAIWSSSIVLIGWVIGKTTEIAFAKFENIYTSIMVVVTSLIIIHLISREIRRIILKIEHRKI